MLQSIPGQPKNEKYFIIIVLLKLKYFSIEINETYNVKSIEEYNSYNKQ